MDKELFRIKTRQEGKYVVAYLGDGENPYKIELARVLETALTERSFAVFRTLLEALMRGLVERIAKSELPEGALTFAKREVEVGVEDTPQLRAVEGKLTKVLEDISRMLKPVYGNASNVTVTLVSNGNGFGSVLSTIDDDDKVVNILHEAISKLSGLRKGGLN